MWHAENVPRPWRKPTELGVSLELSYPSTSIKTARFSKPSPSKLTETRIFGYSLEFGSNPDGKANIQAKMTGHTDYMQASFIEQFFLVGYGANRHVAGPSSPYLTSEQYSRQGLGSPINTLFNDDNPLLSPEQWLLGLDHTAKSEPKDGTAKRALIQAKDILCRVLPDISDVSIAMHGVARPVMSVLFTSPFARVPYSGLSLGYRVMTAWMVDFLRRMYERYSHLPEPETGPAIVLIDEFDLHMHPRWQMEAMDYLGKLFPNTQFIITAHSPLIVQAADGRANLALLRRVKDAKGRNEVIIDNDPVHIKGWRLDQVVTSDLYGLSSSRPKTYSNLIRRRITLLQKQQLSPKEREELQRLNERLHDESPPGGSEADKWLERKLDALGRVKTVAK